MNTDAQAGDTIIVLGGGAGGLGLAIRLAKKFRRSSTRVVLVDREPTHLWKPLLHEVATGSLDGNNDEVRYVSLARKYGFRFVLASVERIHIKDNCVELLVGSSRLPEIPRQQKLMHYTQLAIAVGSVSNDFATEGVLQNAIMLDSRVQAEQFHQSFVAHLHRINNALAIDPSATSNKQLDITIIGGGATGVELAADLHHVTAQLEDYGFESFAREKLNVTLLEAADRLLSQLPGRISQQVEKELAAMGVQISTGSRVVAVDTGMVQVEQVDEQINAQPEAAKQTRIKSDLTVWAAGIRAPDFLKESGFSTDRLGRVKVEQTLNLSADSPIFVLGDCAHCQQPDGSVVPPRAQSAHQMAGCVYKNILALRDAKPLQRFAYHDFGSLVSLSDFSTIGNLMGNLMRGTIFIEGFLARVMYRMLYRRHQLGIHGWTGTALIMIGDLIHRVTRSRIKLH